MFTKKLKLKKTIKRIHELESDFYGWECENIVQLINEKKPIPCLKKDLTKFIYYPQTNSCEKYVDSSIHLHDFSDELITIQHAAVESAACNKQFIEIDSEGIIVGTKFSIHNTAFTDSLVNLLKEECDLDCFVYKDKNNHLIIKWDD